MRKRTKIIIISISFIITILIGFVVLYLINNPIDNNSYEEKDKKLDKDIFHNEIDYEKGMNFMLGDFKVTINDIYIEAFSYYYDSNGDLQRSNSEWPAAFINITAEYLGDNKDTFSTSWITLYDSDYNQMEDLSDIFEDAFKDVIDYYEETRHIYSLEAKYEAYDEYPDFKKEMFDNNETIYSNESYSNWLLFDLNMDGGDHYLVFDNEDNIQVIEFKFKVRDYSYNAGSID